MNPKTVKRWHGIQYGTVTGTVPYLTGTVPYRTVPYHNIALCFEHGFFNENRLSISLGLNCFRGDAPSRTTIFAGGFASPDPSVQIYKGGNRHPQIYGQWGNIIFCRSDGIRRLLWAEKPEELPRQSKMQPRRNVALPPLHQ